MNGETVFIEDILREEPTDDGGTTGIANEPEKDE